MKTVGNQLMKANGVEFCIDWCLRNDYTIRLLVGEPPLMVLIDVALVV